MPWVAPADPLLRYSQRSFRQAIPTRTVLQIFQDLSQTLAQLHHLQIVVGDFNDLNVLVKGTAAYLIDADSFQFGPFPCQMFTPRFVDPLRCDPNAAQLQLQQPHTPDSDWYAFTVMLMQCLLFVDPYGGIYKPRHANQAVPQAVRPLHRITVFHPEVRYPKPALPYHYLPDTLLHHFHRVFEQDWRGPFPAKLLDPLPWKTCDRCGLEHGRPQCPQCVQPQMILVMHPEQGVNPGQVHLAPVFQTQGVILAATQSQGKLRWVYWEAGSFRREAGEPLLHGELVPHLRWRMQGQATWLGYGQQLVTLGRAANPQRQTVDSYASLPQFDGNSHALYWLAQGYLWRQAGLGPQVVGEVLAGQTQFWLGPTFGLGIYRAGQLQGAFVFDVHQPRLNDRVQLAPYSGQMLQASCCFSQGLAWLFLITQEQGVRHYHCQVVAANGAIVAAATSNHSQSHWLTQLGAALTLHHDACPCCAVDDFLLAATDEGIVRIQVQSGQLACTRVFQEPEPYVDASCRLLAGSQGLWLVRDRQIDWLQLH